MTDDRNHTGLRVLSDGFRYDVDKIDDELGIITEHGVTLVHDRTEGELLIQQERAPAASVDTLAEYYTQAALVKGRPTDPCGCSCGCPLHTYDGDESCVWCRNGQHDSMEDTDD